MPATILVTAPSLAPAGMKVLRDADCRVIFTSKTGGVSEMLSLLASELVDGVISRTLTVGQDAFDACPSLKAVSRHGVGFDNVDVAIATARHIPVLIAPATNGQSVAELALGLMLAVARQIPVLDGSVRDGRWERSGSGLQLSGRTLGLVGYGGIGRALGRAARGLGMTVVAFDTLARPEADDPVRMVSSLPDLLRQSQVVSLHVPLTPETRGLIGAAEIALMPRGSLLVNTARGGLVDEAALVSALESGHLAGAGLDTFGQEPLPPDHMLLGRRDVVMTPHMGGSTDAALDATARTAAEHVLAIIQRQQVDPVVCVNPETLKEMQ